MMKRKEKRTHTDNQTPSFQYEEKFIFESNPGEYEFTLDLTYPSQSIIYVSRIDKLCIQFGKLIPLRFKFSNNIPTDSSIKIRILYLYQDSELCTRGLQPSRGATTTSRRAVRGCTSLPVPCRAVFYPKAQRTDPSASLYLSAVCSEKETYSQLFTRSHASLLVSKTLSRSCLI